MEFEAAALKGFCKEFYKDSIWNAMKILHGFFGNAVEFQRDSKGTYRNGDGYLHLRKDVDGHPTL